MDIFVGFPINFHRLGFTSLLTKVSFQMPQPRMVATATLPGQLPMHHVPSTEIRESWGSHVDTMLEIFSYIWWILYGKYREIYHRCCGILIPHNKLMFAKD